MQGDVFTNRPEATDKSSLNDLLLKPDRASSDSEGESVRSTPSQTFLTDEYGSVVESVSRSTNTFLVDDAGVLKSVVRPGTTDIWPLPSSTEWQHIERPSSNRPSEQYREPRVSRDRERQTQGSQIADILSKRQYGWDPWTKTPVRLAPTPLRWEHVRLWCWEIHEEGYWIALTFFLGSILFATGAVGACLHSVEDEQKYTLLRDAEVVPFLVGGILFLVGCTMLIHASWESNRFEGTPYWQYKRKFGGVWEVYPAPGESATDPPELPLHDHHMNRARAEREYTHLYHMGDLWTQRRRPMEIAGSFIIWLGVVLYKVTLTAQLVDTYNHSIAPHPMLEEWLVNIPLKVGGALFVIGGYLLFASANRTWGPAFYPASLTYWIVLFNLLGSIGFFVGAFHLPSFLHPRMPALLSENFPMVFVGYFCGSLAFAIQSWLMVLEIANEDAFDDPLLDEGLEDREARPALP